MTKLEGEEFTVEQNNESSISLGIKYPISKFSLFAHMLWLSMQLLLRNAGIHRSIVVFINRC